MKHKLDYSDFFRLLASFPSQLEKSYFDSDLHSWLERYLKLCEREALSHDERKIKMDAVNPKFILRTHLVQRALEMALKESDFSEITRLRILMENPFEDQPELFEKYGMDSEFYAQETPLEFLGRQTSCSA